MVQGRGVVMGAAMREGTECWHTAAAVFGTARHRERVESSAFSISVNSKSATFDGEPEPDT